MYACINPKRVIGPHPNRKNSKIQSKMAEKKVQQDLKQLKMTPLKAYDSGKNQSFKKKGIDIYE